MNAEPHRGMRQGKFTLNPDNFIGVELCCHYTIGPHVYEQALDYARNSGRRNLSAEVTRLARYFHEPVVMTGEIREELREEKSKRGLTTYRMYFYQMVEITEQAREVSRQQ